MVGTNRRVARPDDGVYARAKTDNRMYRAGNVTEAPRERRDNVPAKFKNKREGVRK